VSIIKQKLLNAIAAHPKLVTFGIGLAITMAIGMAITGMLEHSHLAFASGIKQANTATADIAKQNTEDINNCC
jgi:hypothetical protein